MRIFSIKEQEIKEQDKLRKKETSLKQKDSMKYMSHDEKMKAVEQM